MSTKTTRHILSLSGGKDSTALAVYLRGRIPGLEYVFCDTGVELPDTYQYLRVLEAYLGRRIDCLHDGRGFGHWLDIYGRYLPSARTRWCTRHLKIRPFERHVGNDRVLMYLGIRADEDRQGYISHHGNITAVYPFKEDGITEKDVCDLLASSGLPLPAYYEWRSRSGCYLCFFQQKIEWVGLYEHHPDLFDAAGRFEKLAIESGCPYTWTHGESLADLCQPERIAQVKEDHRRRVATEHKLRPNKTLWEIHRETIEDPDCHVPCDWCRA